MSVLCKLDNSREEIGSLDLLLFCLGLQGTVQYAYFEQKKNIKLMKARKVKRQPPVLVIVLTQKRKQAASRASYNASPGKKRAASRARYRADPEGKRPASRVASHALPTTTCSSI